MLTETPRPATAKASSFVPPDFDGTRWSSIGPLIDQLKSRRVETAEQLEQWMIDRGELEAACGDSAANLYIATTCNTEDPEINQAYTDYVDTIPPRLKPEIFELDRLYVDMAKKLRPEQQAGRGGGRYALYDLSKKTSVAIYRPENVPLETELTKLSQDFGKIAGAMTVEFDGKERTLPQMQKYLLDSDRKVREAAWRGVQGRRLEDRERLNGVYDRMVELRDRAARNAGFPSFIEYAFQARERFDYTPEDCRAFWSAVENHVVPFMWRLDERRRSNLGVDALRPWDLHVDEHGRPPQAPFEDGRDLVKKSSRIFNALDARLGKMFDRMLDGADLDGPAPADGRGLVTPYLDLDSRKGKRPGGYMYNRPHARKTFIFMNAAGLQRDAMTMLHEAGHAFHSMLCEPEPLKDYRDYPTEFAEVASMTMEMLTMPYWSVEGGFYADEASRARAAREHIEDSLMMLCWIATIDCFQHWIYTHPKHTRQERDAYWLTLDSRFGHALSWQGLEAERESLWQRQGHLFSHAMYYIEYGIAQLGALQLWLKSRTDGEKAAVDAYIAGLKLGGSKPLPELFEAAGIEFDFGDEMVARLLAAVEEKLAELPE